MKLGDICSKIGSGATPCGGKDSYKDYGIPIIRSQNVRDWAFSSSGLAFIDDEQARVLSSAVVEQGDVLLNITRLPPLTKRPVQPRFHCGCAPRGA